MVPVKQLGKISWSVVCAACCHMALVFVTMHFYNVKKEKKEFVLLSIPFFL